MNSKYRFLLSALALWGLAALLAAGNAWAQTPPKDAKKSKDAEKAEQPIREQDVYIPYEKLRQVFEKHGRGVFLPYEKFQELWQAALEKSRPAAEQKPPVGALITEITNEATVEKDVVRVKARLKIEVLAEGWNEISLRLSDAAITSATLDGRPARIIGAAGEDYRLLIDKKGKQPESMELALEYARAISRTPGQNSVSFQAPQAPVSRWRIVIPQAGVKVNLFPLIAATEVPAEKQANKTPDETVVLAFVGAAPVVRIDWTPKAAGATGLAAMASVQTEQQLWLSEGVVRTRATLSYSISRAELGQLAIDVPADQRVVNVFDPNVRQWSVKPAEGRQRIIAELFEPAKTAQQVTVELEKITAEKAKDTIAAPVVTAVGVGRQQGVVVVQVAESLRAKTIRTSGLLQIDLRELPAALRGAKWAFAYRYATVPFDLAFDVEKVQPRITVDSLLEARLLPERMTLDLTAVYTIEKAGVFRLEWDVPAGYDVRQVRGTAVAGGGKGDSPHLCEAPSGPFRQMGTVPLSAGAVPVDVDAHYLEGPKKTRLVVNLSRKAIGRVALAVRFERELHQPELLSPLGRPARLELTMPTPAPHTAQQSAGRLVVYAPESLRVNPDKTVGLRSISFKEAFEGFRSTTMTSDKAPPLQWGGVSEQLALAFAYGDEPAALTLAAERRKPQVTVRQLLVARVEEGVVKYDFTFFYNVLYSGVKSLRIDVPAEVAAGLRVATPGVHEKTIEPPPANLAKGDVAWSLSGDSELIGDGRIKLNWEKPLKKLDVGKAVEFPVPYLKSRDVDRAWGQIVLVKSETIDVHESGEPKALRPIDPQYDLMAPVASAARAFEFHDDWSLTVAATRYEMEKIKHTSIERALVRMVVTPANQISVQALYRMRSAGQRLTVELPAGAAFDAQPLRLNNRPAPLEMGTQNEYFIPLSEVKADTPFVLELRYRLPGDGRRLDLPAFPEDQGAAKTYPAVVKTYLAVYLPETRRLLGVQGPWTQEFCWRFGPSWRWQPSPIVHPNGREINPDDRVSWVRETVDLPANPGDDFQTDGVLYEYSTLRPAAGPEGALELVAVDGRSFDGLIFAATVLLGLLLLPARLCAGRLSSARL